MITHFWNWIYQSVNNAISILTTIYRNSEFSPFFDLLLVVVGIGVIIKFILSPLLGMGFIGSSDKASREYDARERQSINTPKDANYRKV